MADMVFYVDEIIQVFNEQFKGSGKPLLYLLHGLNTDSSNFSKPASFEVSNFILSSSLAPEIWSCLFFFFCLDAENELSYGISCDQEFWYSDAHSVFLIFGISFVPFYYCYGLLQGIEKFETDLTTLHPILAECRVIKSSLELQLIQFANDISSEAHVEVMRRVTPGMKEYQMESMFLHHTYMYGGCRHCSYTCICATGDNR